MIPYHEMLDLDKKVLDTFLSWCNVPYYIGGPENIAGNSIYETDVHSLLSLENWAILPSIKGERGPEYLFEYMPVPFIKMKSINWGKRNLINMGNTHDVYINGYYHRPEMYLSQSWWTHKVSEKMTTSDCIDIINRAMIEFRLMNIAPSIFGVWIDKTTIKRTAKRKINNETFREFTYKSTSPTVKITFDIWENDNKPVRLAMNYNGKQYLLTAGTL